MEKQFVLEISELLWATPLVSGGKSAEIAFTSPEKPGRYPFICTFRRPLAHYARRDGGRVTIVSEPFATAMSCPCPLRQLNGSFPRW